MRRARTYLAGLGVSLALSIALAAPVLGHGPQALPGAACNGGTMNAHGSLGPNAKGHDHIPHSHDGGVTCVHLNPSIH